MNEGVHVLLILSLKGACGNRGSIRDRGRGREERRQKAGVGRLKAQGSKLKGKRRGKAQSSRLKAHIARTKTEDNQKIEGEQLEIRMTGKH